MTSTDHLLTAPDDEPRARLLELVGAIQPWDDLERTHLETATQWIAAGAPVYRVRKPDVPAVHLVSYFVVLDHARGQLLLVAHRKAGLWLPAGGHVEPGEDPWAAVVRECREELGIDAVASPVTGKRPLFLTVTRTRGQRAHTDVSLWYLLNADAHAITSYDQGEFDAIWWLTDEQVLEESGEMLDPHMHRFTRKLQHARTRRHRNGDSDSATPSAVSSPASPVSPACRSATSRTMPLREQGAVVATLWTASTGYVRRLGWEAPAQVHSWTISTDELKRSFDGSGFEITHGATEQVQLQLRRLGIEGTRARLRFDRIVQPWLRELATGIRAVAAEHRPQRQPGRHRHPGSQPVLRLPG